LSTTSPQAFLGHLIYVALDYHCPRWDENIVNIVNHCLVPVCYRYCMMKGKDGFLSILCFVGGKMSVFDTSLKFCPECGTIFPLPTGGEYVSCMNTKCHYQVPVSGL